MQIPLFGFKTVESGFALVRVQLRLRPPGKRKEVRSIPLADGLGFSAHLEALQAELANGFQHHVP
jgi:hypothetical protein